MNLRRAIATSALFLSAYASSAFAQSLTNGTFHSDISGWSADTGATATWSPVDADGSGSSGSALVTNTMAGSNSSATASQCVAVTPNFQYTVSGRIRIPAGQVKGRAALSLAWFSDASCSTQISSASTGAVKPTNKWFTKSATLTAPGAAAAVKVQLRVLKQATGTLGAHFDNVTLTNPPGVLQFSSATYSAGEGAGTLDLTVARSVGSTGAVGVNYTVTNGSATNGSDFTLANGSLSFANGEISKTISVPISDDANVEGDESFSVALSGVTGGASIGTTSSTTASIIENDVPIPGTLQFQLTATSVNEDAGLATLYLTRTDGVAGIVSVDYETADLTAEAGTDYTSDTGSIVFADGQSSQSVTIQINPDSVVESDESFTVTLSNPQGGAILGTPITTNVTIANDDLPPGQISFTLGSYSVAESAGTATLAGVITRTGGTSGDITATLVSTDVTTTEVDDYAAVNETVTFLDGDDTPEDVTLTVVDDLTGETDENLALTLSNATGGASIGSIPTAAVTILDNDTANVRPTITALGPINIERGSGITEDIATVSDSETAAGSLVVSATTPTGITVGSFVNSAGDVSATVSVLCTVAPGSYVAVLTVTDGGGATETAELTINVTASTAPVITAPIEVTVNSTGHIGSVVPNGGSSYQWFLAGGTGLTNSNTPTATFNAGLPGTTMSLQVIETPATGCVTATGTKKISVDFLDVAPSHIFRSFINTLARNAITAGCGTGIYCPNNAVTREQMAVFVLLGKHGTGFSPAPATGVFGDVPAGSPFARWIERLASEGITAGCGNGNYCPTRPVTRAEMAVFLVVAKYGTGVVLPPAIGTFSDVPASDPFAKFIERLAADGITAGCGNGKYCPNSPNTRGEMAVFLQTTFNLQ